MRFLLSHSLKFLTVSLSLLAFSSSADDSLEQLVKEFDRYFVQKMRSAKVPGAAYAVVHDGEIIKIRPYGVRKQRTSKKVDAHTSFRLASISKTFAAGLAAIEENRGSFSWDDPVFLYVPDIQFNKPEHKQYLQIKHLLSHTSGFVPNAYDNLIEANQKLEKIIPQFTQLKPLCKPGECYGYQNVIYNLIQLVLEQSAGKSYPELMQERIFTPLQMTNASIGREAFVENPNHATGHLKLKRGWLPREPKQAYYNFPAAAGVNASITDMAHWLLAQLGQYPNVLNNDELKKLTTPRVETRRNLHHRQWRNYLSSAEYGMGWRLYEFNHEPLVYHGGWVAGYRSDLAYSPERKIGFVVLLNAESNAINYVTTHFWDMVSKQDRFAQLQERLQRPATPSVSPAAHMLRQGMLQPYRSQDY